MSKAFSKSEHDDARHRLLVLGRQKIAERGFEKVSISELCRDVKIAKGQFYRYFSSKNCFFFHVRQTIVDDLHTLLKSELKPEKHQTKDCFADALFAFLKYIQRPQIRPFFDTTQLHGIFNQLTDGEREDAFLTDVFCLKTIVNSFSKGKSFSDEQMRRLTALMRSAFIASTHEIFYDQYTDDVLLFYSTSISNHIHQLINS